MPVHNGERFLREAIASILEQSLSELELVVVDDASTDGTAEIAHSFGDDRVRYLRNACKSGPAFSRNRAIEAGRAEFLALMDADDVSHSDRLRMQLAFLLDHPRVGVVGTGFQEINEAGKPVGSLRRFACDPNVLERLLVTEYPFANPSLMFRREVFRRVGPYRSALDHAEDIDLMLRISEHFDVANMPECLLKYRIHPESLSNQKAYLCFVATRAARECARLRRAGFEDPCEGTTELTRDVLIALGISNADCELYKAEAYRIRVGRMLATGDLAASDRILREFEADEISTEARCRIASEVTVLRVRLLWANRRRAAAIALLVRECARSPRLCATVAAKAWWFLDQRARTPQQ